jgi:hypothetical protein
MLKGALILFLVLLLSPASSVVSQEVKKISLGYPSLAFTQSHIWVAKEGEERQTGAIYRSELSSGAGKRRLLYRNGEKVSVEVKTIHGDLVRLKFSARM